MGRQDLRTHLGNLLQRKMAPQPRPTQAFPPARNVGQRQAKVVSLALPLVRLGLPALQPPTSCLELLSPSSLRTVRMSQMRRRRKRKTASGLGSSLWQECSEEEDGYSSEEAENEEDEDDTEEAEEDEEEEEMMVPGMEGKEEPGSDSGTTAVVALIRGKQLIVANAGDSRCVVSEAGKALDMSYDHKPEDEVELARIKNAGGKVTMDGRVNGGLNLSRAIGDHFYKRNKNLPPEEQMISALPDIKVLTLTDDHEFMVIACDGIWNVMSSQEVIDFIQSKISQRDENGELRLLSSIVEELLDQCLAPDTSGDGTGCDNMTCIIICFKPRNTAELQPESGKRKLEEVLSTEGAEENGNSDNKKKAKRD
uniref:protein-serine/threonine phosphatase n=1 Tax=Rousettus aegyptiacus TaxID=9407 RepID=A0A7J8FKX6_ROUAE|nr:protein phosphatase, Mg2+/Mn2+ dependent 1G [Rousettus aegyptiacus]